MIASLFDRTPLDAAVDALARDLKADGGPAISTMRNYRFAILAYAPSSEFRLRNRIRALSDELTEAGWQVLSISLHALLIRHIRAIGDEALQSIMARETRTWNKDSDRALAYLIEQVTPWIEGANGIAGEVVSRINEFARDRSAVINPCWGIRRRHSGASLLVGGLLKSSSRSEDGSSSLRSGSLRSAFLT